MEEFIKGLDLIKLKDADSECLLMPIACTAACPYPPPNPPGVPAS